MVDYILAGGFFAACVTGFFVLLKMINGLHREVEVVKVQLKESVSFKWFEGTYKPEMRADLKPITDDLKIIKNALLGDGEKIGLVGRIHEHEGRIKRIEEKCSITHGKNSL